MITKSFISLLRNADTAGQLEHAKKWQVIDLNTVESELKSKPDLKQEMAHLSSHYPSLCIHILRYLNKHQMIEKYMSWCKKFENDPKNYSIYIHGYFLVWLDQQRKAGKLK